MKPTKEHLDKINSRLAGHTMTEDSVEVLPFLVFNDKLTDRHTIMSEEMLAKLEQDLNDGKVAFNKLHESRYNLPVGSSVSGRLVKKEGGIDLQAMMYAVTKRPDGTPFEEGKDLADRYATGAARACSAGVQVGFYKCSVCGNDIRDWNACDHIPGREYKKDEQCITCVALMTGHEIVNGIAQDCGIYEVSAVTAGGVAAAGSLTEAFGAYEEGADVTEFKKSVSEEKQLSLRVELTTAPVETTTIFSQEEDSMDKKDVEALLQEHYDPLKQELSAAKEGYEKACADLTAKQEEFDVVTKELETTKSEFEAAKDELAMAKEAEPFKAAYFAILAAQATKAGEEVTPETYAGKTVEDCETLLKGYAAKIAEFPTGQELTGDGTGETLPSLDPAFYKV